MTLNARCATIAVWSTPLPCLGYGIWPGGFYQAESYAKQCFLDRLDPIVKFELLSTRQLNVSYDISAVEDQFRNGVAPRCVRHNWHAYTPDLYTNIHYYYMSNSQEVCRSDSIITSANLDMACIIHSFYQSHAAEVKFP